MRYLSTILRQIKFIPKVGVGLVLLLLISVVSLGQVISFPYTEDFDASYDATTTNTPQDASTYQFNLAKGSGRTGLCAGVDYGSSNDAWFWITFNGTQDYSYTVSGYEKYAGEGSFNIYISGTKTSAAMEATSPLLTLSASHSSFTSFSATAWTCPSDGTYYIGFNLKGNSASVAKLDDITISRTNPCNPTTQASSLNTSNITSENITVGWTRGNGNKVLVLAKKTSSALANPTNGVTYTANSVFGSGTQIGSGNFVVYDGNPTTSGSVTVTELDMSTSYDFIVYEYNTGTGCFKIPGASATVSTLRSTKYYVNDGNTSGDIFCSVTGDNSYAGTRPTKPKLTLAGLLNAGYTFQSGDIIYIDAGTYNSDGGTATTDEHQLDIGAGYSGVTFLGAGWDKTIFDHNYGGTSTDFFMYIHANNNLTLKDMQVKRFENNGSQTPGHSGQAFTISGSTNVLFDHVLMQLDGKSGGNPSISVIANSTVTLKAGGSMCNVWHTQYTGGVEAFGNNITLNIQDYVLGYNYKSGSYDGAGLLISNANNTTTVNVTNTRFYNNEASDGGGISQRGGVLNVSDCIIDGNLAGQTSTTIYGGGVRISGGTATFTRVKFTNNSIGSGGGTLKGGAIAAYSLDGNVSLTLDNCSFSGNAATGDDIYAQKSFSNSISISASQTTFSSSSDAIYNEDGTISLTNCGNPSIAGPNSPAVSFVNTTSPSSTPSPNPPSFSGSCGSISSLPVELVSFEGTCDDNKVILSWVTASEINNNYFTIEKSTDALNWETLITVAGAGNSNYFLSYSVTDDGLNARRHYYRLKQTDYDGQFAYSDIISFASCQPDNFEMLVANNPVINSMNVLISSSDTQVARLYVKDMLGRNIIEKDVNLDKGENSLWFDVSTIRSGIYIIGLEPKFSGKPVIKEILINN